MNRLNTARFITQIAGWILFFSLPLVFMYNQNNSEDAINAVFTWNYCFFCGTFLSLFYLFSYVLIPQLYLKKRYVAYYSIVFLLFSGVYVLKPFDKLMSDHQGNRMAGEMKRPPQPWGHGPESLEQYAGDGKMPPLTVDRKSRPPGPPENRTSLLAFDIVSIFLFIMIVALTMAIEIDRQLQLAQKKAIKAETDRAEAELSFLKAQINPHFLYNTLNNIYTLAITASPNTAESIMRLSNIMRYITDDIKDELVALQDELDCISNFIGLQELRLGGKNPIIYKVNGKAGQQKIAPLILMTFIENAFKYGVSKHKKSPIKIEITIDGHRIGLYVKNVNYAKQAGISSTGIGIENTKQRLQYLYPGKHELNIDASEASFIINLKLDI